MVYCSVCGQKLEDDANFCPKCGTKTPKGRASKALYPSDQLTDAFYSVGLELEKAFNLAAKETHSAIQKARENLLRTGEQPTVACPKCGSKNPSGSVFCNNCGSKIAATEESHSSGA